GFHAGLGERLELSSLRNQAAQRSRIFGVIGGDHVVGGSRSSLCQDGLIVLGQLVVDLLVHIQRDLQRAFPPARVLIVVGDFVETELFVVVRSDPFGGVDRAFFQ